VGKTGAPSSASIVRAPYIEYHAAPIVDSSVNHRKAVQLPSYHRGLVLTVSSNSGHSRRVAGHSARSKRPCRRKDMCPTFRRSITSTILIDSPQLRDQASTVRAHFLGPNSSTLFCASARLVATRGGSRAAACGRSRAWCGLRGPVDDQPRALAAPPEARIASSKRAKSLAADNGDSGSRSGRRNGHGVGSGTVCD